MSPNKIGNISFLFSKALKHIHNNDQHSTKTALHVERTGREPSASHQCFHGTLIQSLSKDLEGSRDNPHPRRGNGQGRIAGPHGAALLSPRQDHTWELGPWSLPGLLQGTQASTLSPSSEQQVLLSHSSKSLPLHRLSEKTLPFCITQVGNGSRDEVSSWIMRPGRKLNPQCPRPTTKWTDDPSDLTASAASQIYFLP